MKLLKYLRYQLDKCANNQQFRVRYSDNTWSDKFNYKYAVLHRIFFFFGGEICYIRYKDYPEERVR